MRRAGDSCCRGRRSPLVFLANQGGGSLRVFRATDRTDPGKGRACKTSTKVGQPDTGLACSIIVARWFHGLAADIAQVRHIRVRPRPILPETELLRAGKSLGFEDATHQVDLGSDCHGHRCADNRGRTRDGGASKCWPVSGTTRCWSATRARTSPHPVA